MVNKKSKKDKEENGNIKSNIFPFVLIFVMLIYTRIHLENELTLYRDMHKHGVVSVGWCMGKLVQAIKS